MQSVPPRVWGDTGDHTANAPISAAPSHADDNCLLPIARRRPAAHANSVPPFSAVIGLIYLHRRTIQLKTILGQKAAGSVEDAPSGLIGDPDFPLNLLGGDPQREDPTRYIAQNQALSEVLDLPKTVPASG